MARIKPKRSGKERRLPPSPPAALALGTLAGGLVMLLLVGAAAALAAGTGLPPSLLRALAVAALAAGGLTSGWVTVRKTGKQGLLWGAAAGVLLAVLRLGAGTAILARGPVPADALGAVTLLLAAVAGGVAAVQHLPKRR